MRPLIAITPSFVHDKGPPPRQRVMLNAAYADAITLAGGLPVVLAPPPERQKDRRPAGAGGGPSPSSEGTLEPEPAYLEQVLRLADGLLFTGGPDLDPRHYGQKPHEKTQVMHPRRDAFDIALFRAADAAKKPIFSVCLGCQIANVARGGCLIQHVDDVRRENPLTHHLPGGESAYHDVEIVPGSALARIVGSTRIRVNSRHHQALDPSSIGDELRPVAHAPDGIIEAVENMEGRFFLAVQWHPEDMIDQREHMALFEALVAAARR
ncbi:MAG: gamma-glutamyl-gamma-aminobutyrate hydrolase family protein [Phycisphaerales bacterium]|nr:gamma-glutamyl-gamma-aminobutyrate hydrolase family protein [Phycisphaerales bacterium]